MKILVRILIALFGLAGIALGVALALQESQKPDYITLNDNM